MKNSMVVRAGSVAARMLQIQLARQHDLRQAYVLQKAGLFRRADVRLRAGVQLQRRQVQLQQAHVLDDERIRPGLVHLPGHLARVLQLVVAQDGVQGNEDAAVEPVGVADEPLQLAQVVAGGGARSEGRAADVDGIRAMVHGLDADVGIARGREQFKQVGLQGHRARIIPARPFACPRGAAGTVHRLRHNLGFSLMQRHRGACLCLHGRAAWPA